MQIVLVGASKKARLVLDFLNEEGVAEQVVGVVDRDPALWNTMILGKPVLGSLESLLATASRSDTAFCICMSERFFADRASVSSLLDQHGFARASLISKHAKVSATATIAEGSILFPGVIVGTAASVGACVTIYTAALVEHDCVVSANVEISSRAVLAGGVKVNSSSFIGVNATVLPNVIIGECALVGAGAVVTKDVAEGIVVAGNPARALRGRQD